jgi:hypothetical protein
MSHELDGKLEKLAASANYTPAGLKDLFEGWDIVDFMMVRQPFVKRVIQQNGNSHWMQSLVIATRIGCKSGKNASLRPGEIQGFRI